MRRVLLEGVEDLLRRRPKNVVYFVNLVQLVIAWKQREKGEDLEEDATDTPYVHLVAIVAICHQAFGRSVPPR